VVEATRHLRQIAGDIRRLRGEELFAAAKELQARPAGDACSA
jgi:pyridoxal biosynthesis lyase PdxS